MLLQVIRPEPEKETAWIVAGLTGCGNCVRPFVKRIDERDKEYANASDRQVLDFLSQLKYKLTHRRSFSHKPDAISSNKSSLPQE